MRVLSEISCCVCASGYPGFAREGESRNVLGGVRVSVLVLSKG